LEKTTKLDRRNRSNYYKRNRIPKWLEKSLLVFVDEQRLTRHFWTCIKALFHEGIDIYEKRSQYIKAQLLPVERQFQSVSQKAPGDRPTEKIVTYLPAPLDRPGALSPGRLRD
jgi:hypothetical protein